ncbi:MAG: nitrogen fixation/metabolism regulation signal transduction histidine kinase [Gammaproteobacteria bacterium]|jgi:nitrogen fixation/metabolism regulation signal transduction histidine kinase
MNGQLDKPELGDRKVILLLGILLFVFMLASLVMMSDALQNPDRFGDYMSGLLIFNALGLLSLVILIAANLKNLVNQLKHKLPGARMTFKTVSMFAILSTIPVLILYYFSLNFLYSGIDSWFNPNVEQALSDSLELSKISLNERMREVLNQTEQVATEISYISDNMIPAYIDEFRDRIGANELTVLSRKGNFIASSSSANDLVPNRPNETILFQLQQGANFVGLTSFATSEFSIQSVVNIPVYTINTEPRLLQALVTISERINTLASNVQFAYGEYQELSYLREQLKLGFVSILTLVLLFSIFSALWASFYSATRLAAPIRNLADGTKSIAEGDYSKQLPVPSNDELGFLVSSFNEMTKKISNARDNAKNSQVEAETQKAYLEAVLARLSSGVLVVDNSGNLRTSNLSCNQILGIDLANMTGQQLNQIQDNFKYLEPLIQAIEYHYKNNINEWREQITLFGTSGRQILMCSGTTLSLIGIETSRVHVIVFDEITALIQGQKDAAWSEMARRLAHEIKNPLTPIQLAAERLRLKYIKTMKPSQFKDMDKLTNTIIQQVETMKDMVNTFSEYAQTPKTPPKLFELNKLIEEVVDLYNTLDSNITVKLDLAQDLPQIKGDPDRTRRVFNNLLNNAFEAMPHDMHTVLEIRTEYIADHGLDFVEIRIKDYGSGISDELIDNIFEPYVSTKPKGTGLGLAIVKKIIEEHGGIVWLENNLNSNGVCAIIRLPAVMQTGYDNVKTTSNRVLI